MIISVGCTINVLLAFALAIASVVNYAHKDTRVWSITIVIIYDHDMFLIQATGVCSNLVGSAPYRKQ